MLDPATRWILSPISLALLLSRCFTRTNAMLVAKTLYMHNIMFLTLIQGGKGCYLK